MAAQVNITRFNPNRSASLPTNGDEAAYIKPLIDLKPEIAPLLQWNSVLRGFRNTPKAKNIPMAPKTYASKETATIFDPLAHSPPRLTVSANSTSVPERAVPSVIRPLYRAKKGLAGRRGFC